MDNDLVEFATKLPLNMKVRKLSPENRMNENIQTNKKAEYFKKTNDGKYLLRKAMAPYTSSAISERDKQGFSAPDATWFRGDSIDYVKKLLLDPSAPIYGVFDYETVRELLESHFSGKSNKRLLIWSLLYVNELQG